MKKKSLVLLLALMLTVAACGKEPEVGGSNDSATVESKVENVDDEGTEAEQESEPVVEAKVSVAENFTYTEENGEITITGYEGDATVLEIPESINGMPVVTIGESAFPENQNIVEVVIPDSVKVIGESAFVRCYNLSKVTLGQSVEVIDSCAFWMTALEAIDFPEGVHTIGSFAFNSTSLKELVIPSKVEVISAAAFSGIDVETLVIPGTVKEVQEQAFTRCENVQTVVIEEGVEIVGERAFDECDAMTSLTLPSTLTEETDAGNFWGAGSAEHKVTIYVPSDCVLKDAILELYNDGYNHCCAEVIE